MQSPASIADIFAQAASGNSLLEKLVAYLRPAHPDQYAAANQRLKHLVGYLQQHPAHTQALAAHVASAINSSQVHDVLTESGLLNYTTLLSEIGQRFIGKWLPQILPDGDIRQLIRKVFHRPDDYQWLQALDAAYWVQLVELLHPHLHVTGDSMVQQLFQAGSHLSFSIAAAGTSQRMRKVMHQLQVEPTAFAGQNQLWHAYMHAWQHQRHQLGHAYHQLNQALRSDMAVVERIRQAKDDIGTSMNLTFTLNKLVLQLQRLELVLRQLDPHIDVPPAELVRLLHTMVQNENTATRIRPVLNQSVGLLAYQIAEHGSHTGEKYITANRAEYWQFFRSAAIGGLIISFAAFLKVKLTALHLPYFWASFCYGLNYALAFVVVHYFHGTIATKQPALTASAIAQAIGQHGTRRLALHNLAILNARVARSQFASLMGNLVVVIPLCMLLAWLYQQATGQALILPEQVGKTLADVQPAWHNTWYAAVAGVLLFLSGIVSGYFDNLVVHTRIQQRIARHPSLNHRLGTGRTAALAAYVGKNMGAIMGNILLGFGLGFMIFFGKVLGLPLDIRHVTISSGFFGFSAAGSGFSLPAATIWWCALGLSIIALTNLLVSFTLALVTAMKSRQLRLRQLLPLAGLTLRYFLHFPAQFFYPPAQPEAQASPAPGGH